MRLILGDCLEKLKELDDNSIDSIVTDPPYGLSFMGKTWDYDVPSVEIWKECMRVLKPGGHLLSFAGSRTYHRMAVRIEDAGFEIRDQIMWIYGSGFPKSLNIGKSVDKLLGNEREIVGEYIHPDGKPRNIKNHQPNEDVRQSDHQYGYTSSGFIEQTKGTSQYEGWGTALKPAHEPIVMARKPLSEKTVVDNVLEWGTGGINIDDSRIHIDLENEDRARGKNTIQKTSGIGFTGNKKDSQETPLYNLEQGRFPANIIFDEEAGKILDEQSGISKSTGGRSGNKEGVGQNGIYGQYKGEVRDENPGIGDSGGASRFFYCPKTSKKDRNEGVDGNIHPTVKPTDLMLYLIRLVTPKGGTTLDPFMGSGSTGKAAVRGGFDFVGIEKEEEYMEIATARIQYEIDNPYNEQTKRRVEVKKETQNTLDKFFG